LRNAPGTQVVDLHLAATRGRARATHHQAALRQGVDFAVGAAQRRGNQHAALERLGVAHGGHVHIHKLARLRKGGQLRRHDHGGHVLELQLARQVGRQAHTHVLQVVLQRLGGVGHLRGLVARAVQTHHQAVAGELVAAHALHGRHFLDAQRLGGPGSAKRQHGQQRPE
jgi:hypothetical protein